MAEELTEELMLEDALVLQDFLQTRGWDVTVRPWHHWEINTLEEVAVEVRDPRIGPVSPSVLEPVATISLRRSGAVLMFEHPQGTVRQTGQPMELGQLLLDSIERGVVIGRNHRLKILPMGQSYVERRNVKARLLR